MRRGEVCAICRCPMLVIVLSGVLLAATLGSADKLEVSPDFHSVTLHWGGVNHIPPETNEEPGRARALRNVVVTFCELQAWGPHRCKDKSVTASRAGRVFSARVNGLRMATRYSFLVRPARSDETEDEASTESSVPTTSVTAQTKGFSARATLCLLNSTEVEVDTGPFFGGRISVEALSGPPGDIGPSPNADQEGTSCSVWGDPQSSRATYRLRFDHEACGGTRAVNRSAVATFVLVQESLPILTHSTRRFLVLCTAQPDTLTVSAGISLPGGVGAAPASENSIAGAGSAEPQRGARLLRNPSKKPLMLPTLQEPHTQHLPHLQPRLAGSSGAQLVLMLALVSTVALGSGFAAWWAVRRHKDLQSEDCAPVRRRRDLDSSSNNAVTLSRSSSFGECDDDDFSITTYDNFTRRGASSVSEASSVLRGDSQDDATSCSSVSTCSDLSSGDHDTPVQIRILQEPPARVHSNLITTINIHKDDENSQSEA